MVKTFLKTIPTIVMVLLFSACIFDHNSCENVLNSPYTIRMNEVYAFLKVQTISTIV